MVNLLAILDTNDICPSVIRAFNKFKESVHKYMPLDIHVVPDTEINRPEFGIVLAALKELQYISSVRTSYSKYRNGLYEPPAP